VYSALMPTVSMQAGFIQRWSRFIQFLPVLAIASRTSPALTVAPLPTESKEEGG
jgi:hypothetical protein